MAIDKNKIVGTLRKVGETVGQTVGELRDNAKLSFDIAGKESELADLYRELGKATYEVGKGNLPGMTPESLVAVIDTKNRELEELKAKKVDLNAPQTCDNCGRELDDGATFCSRCGTRVETVGARVRQTAAEVKEDVKEAWSGIREKVADAAGDIRESFGRKGEDAAAAAGAAEGDCGEEDKSDGV